MPKKEKTMYSLAMVRALAEERDAAFKERDEAVANHGNAKLLEQNCQLLHTSLKTLTDAVEKHLIARHVDILRTSLCISLIQSMRVLTQIESKKE